MTIEELQSIGLSPEQIRMILEQSKTKEDK